MAFFIHEKVFSIVIQCKIVLRIFIWTYIAFNIIFFLQGLEIVNPQAAETRINEANAKYFSNTSGFLSVGKKTT